MYSYEEKMRAVELYLKYGLSAAAVINELEQHIKKNKLPAKDQRVVLSHNNYIMVVVRLSATIRHFRLQSKPTSPNMQSNTLPTPILNPFLHILANAALPRRNPCSYNRARMIRN